MSVNCLVFWGYFFVADLVSFEGDLTRGYHIRENQVNTAETQTSDQHDRKAERRNFPSPVTKIESGEFTSLSYVSLQF